MTRDFVVGDRGFLFAGCIRLLSTLEGVSEWGYPQPVHVLDGRHKLWLQTQLRERRHSYCSGKLSARWDEQRCNRHTPVKVLRATRCAQYCCPVVLLLQTKGSTPSIARGLLQISFCSAKILILRINATHVQPRCEFPQPMRMTQAATTQKLGGPGA